MTEVVRLRVHDAELALERREGVFMPSQNGLFYAESVAFRAGERVLDIGTGSGLLAILAAQQGAEACATDISAAAVEAARDNARRNGVTIDARVGRLAAGFTGPFDVIVANLPNEIVAPAYLATLSAEEASSFAGGALGNEQILALLDAAPALMHGRSRLYLPVHTLTDWHGVLSAALRRFSVRLLTICALPAKPFVVAHLDFYRELDERGIVHVFRQAGRWHTYGYVYELRLLKEGGA